MNFSNHLESVSITVKKFLQGQGKVLAIEPTIDTEDSGTYRLITYNKDHDVTINKLGVLQTHLMKEKKTNPTMITSFERFGKYIEVNGSPPTSDPTNDLVERLELQIKNLMTPTQQNIQNIPDTPRSLWDIPSNISIPTALSPTSTTLTTYKSVVQNQTMKNTQPKSNQNRTVALTGPPQQRQQEQQQQQQRSQRDQDKMDTDSSKSEISEISATPTTKSMKSMMTTVSAMRDKVTELQKVAKTSDEDRRAADVERIRRE